MTRRFFAGVLCALWLGTAAAGGSGKVGQHRYDWVMKGTVATALFEPFLPRDDTVLVTALKDFMGTVYGSGLAPEPKPGIVSRGGTNLLRIRGAGWDYLFLIVKDEATGTVASASMWRERRTD